MKRPFKPEIKLGADRKRIFILGGLLVVLIAVWFINSSDSGAPPSSSSTATAARPTPPPAPGGRGPRAPARKTTKSANNRLSVQEFRPTLKPKDPIDPSRVDPTLRLDILARLRNVKADGGSRSLFEFGTAAPVAAAKELPKVAPINPLQSAMTTGPVKPPPPTPPPPPPPPPPIPLKFYGYTNTQRQTAGPKRAFFLEGEDIFVAGEGDVVKNRYKIIRIGVNSAVVEDTTNKNQQTLPLVQEMSSS